MINRRTRRGIIVLALVAFLTAMLARNPAEIIIQPDSDLDTRLNYAMYEFSGRLLNDEGAVNMELDAPVLRSNAQTGIGTVESPEVRIREEQERWKITAESAIITADREHVSLMGDVRMVRRNLQTGETLDIRTRDVMLNVTPRTASTEAAVSIRQPGSRLDAVGMNLDMIQEEFELHNKVEAHYEVP